MRKIVLVNDSDHETVDKCKDIYEILNVLGIPITVAVFCKTEDYLKDDTQSLEDKEYVKFLKELKLRGNEIAFHGYSEKSNTRDEFDKGINWFKNIFGNYPFTYIEHGGVKGYHMQGIKKEAIHNEGNKSESDYYCADIIKHKFGAFCPTHLSNHYISEDELKKILRDSNVLEIGLKREYLHEVIVSMSLDKFTDINTDCDILYTHFGYENQEIGWNKENTKIYLSMFKQMKEAGFQFMTMEEYINGENSVQKNSESNEKRMQNLFKAEEQVIKKYIKKDMKILDLGCGKGRKIPELLKQTDDITCLDINVTFVNIAKRKYPQLQYIYGDLNKILDYKDQYDCIVSFGDSMPLGYEKQVNDYLDELFQRTNMVIFSFPYKEFLDRGQEKTFIGVESIDLEKLEKYNILEVVKIDDVERFIFVLEKKQ